MQYSLLLLPAAYIVGSINFSIILFKILGKSDPRNSFSGNPGTTNVYRQTGIVWAIAVLSLDMGRAIAVYFLAIRILHENYVTWAGLFLIIGNRFPCFHGFRGGKGVANYLGFTAFLSPYSAGFSCAAWVMTYGLIKKPFIASFAMISVLAAGTVLKTPQNLFAISGTIVTYLLIIMNHYGNILDLARNKIQSEKNNG
ncbi:glycerol-3-phosphate acyltransferase [bacterium]|nr:glycerol-3-phosphate acyltransferase [bacterium]